MVMMKEIYVSVELTILLSCKHHPPPILIIIDKQVSTQDAIITGSTQNFSP